MTDEQIAKIADIRAISGLPEAYRAAFRLGVEQERARCIALCKAIAETSSSRTLAAAAETCARAIEGGE